ncbi:MAG: DUF2304 domain-containing protein [Cellulomonas sp.]
MWIKVILLLSIGVIALIGLRAPRGARHVALRRIALIAFVLFAAGSVLFPGVWNALANAVGVGRGTDLLLYMLIVVFLGYMASSYLRFRGVESQITLLARRIALDEVGVTPTTAPLAPREVEQTPIAAPPPSTD